MEKYYNVSVFSGVPVTKSDNNYALSLRLAAAYEATVEDVIKRYSK